MASIVLVTARHSVYASMENVRRWNVGHAPNLIDFAAALRADITVASVK